MPKTPYCVLMDPVLLEGLKELKKRDGIDTSKSVRNAIRKLLIEKKILKVKSDENRAAMGT